jgi:transcriptional regulator with XRE-family HTH domain
MKFGRRLQRERERRGMTQRELGLKVGLTSGTYISQIESGEKIPPLETSIKLANSLGLEDTYPFVMHAVREKSNVEYEYLTSRLSERPAEDYDTSMRALPVRAWSSIAEGNLPTGHAGSSDDVCCIVMEDIEDVDAFVVSIESDWMSPVINPGDMAIISPNTEVASGDLALVRVGGKRGSTESEIKLTKILFRDTWTDLIPGDTDKYPIETAQSNAVTILGRVVRRTSTL